MSFRDNPILEETSWENAVLPDTGTADTAVVSTSPDNEEHSMPPTARDGIRRRLISDRARAALDALSDEDIFQLREALREHSDQVEDELPEQSLRTPMPGDRRRRTSRDSIPPQKNPANFLAEGKKDERRYPRNPANPGFEDERTGEAEDADEHAATRKELFNDLRDGDARAWKFVKSRLHPEDFDKLRELVLSDLDISPSPPLDDDDADAPNPLAGDSRHLPDSVFRALNAARHLHPRDDDAIGRQSSRPTQRERVLSLAMDSRSTRRIAEQMEAIAPGVSKIGFR